MLEAPFILKTSIIYIQYPVDYTYNNFNAPTFNLGSLKIIFSIECYKKYCCPLFKVMDGTTWFNKNVSIKKPNLEMITIKMMSLARSTKKKITCLNERRKFFGGTNEQFFCQNS